MLKLFNHGGTEKCIGPSLGKVRLAQDDSGGFNAERQKLEVRRQKLEVRNEKADWRFWVQRSETSPHEPVRVLMAGIRSVARHALSRQWLAPASRALGKSCLGS